MDYGMDGRRVGRAMDGRMCGLKGWIQGKLG